MLENKEIKLVFFDIDDTLIVKDTQYMPASVSLAIAKLKANGVKIGIASGRTRFGVVPRVEALDPEIYVTTNGQYVVTNKGELIYENPIPQEVVREFVNWCDTVDVDYGFAGSEKCVVSKWSDVVRDAIDVVYGKIDIEPDFYMRHEVYQMWTFSEKRNEDQLPTQLAAVLNIVRWHKNSCDFFPINGSKAKGIQKVLDQLNLSPENIIVFGDGLNDIEMFKHAGFTVAMGNAHPDLLQYADFVTTDIDKDGIKNALEVLGLI
ncbi:flavin mononucleotide phosphatase [Erysipelotrichaceae bacterium]|nr:flavin mononucleotide phosphatase [Erysipelotrichaceae bacterium]